MTAVRVRKFTVGETVTFTAGAEAVKRWYDKTKPNTKGERTVVAYPHPAIDDVLLSDGVLWGDGWLESVTPAPHPQPPAAAARIDTGAGQSTPKPGDGRTEPQGEND